MKRLLRHPFRSDLHLTGRDLPVAVIIAGNDTVVPHERSEALLRVLRRPVSIRTVPGSTHNGIYDLPAIDIALREALESVLRSCPTQAGTGPSSAP